MLVLIVVLVVVVVVVVVVLIVFVVVVVVLLLLSSLLLCRNLKSRTLHLSNNISGGGSQGCSLGLEGCPSRSRLGLVT